MFFVAIYYIEIKEKIIAISIPGNEAGTELTDYFQWKKKKVKVLKLGHLRRWLYIHIWLSIRYILNDLCFYFILAAKEDTNLSYVLETHKKKTNLITIYLLFKVGSRERNF